MALTDQCVAAYRMDEIPGADRADLTGRGNALASIFPGASNTKALNIMDGGAGGHWVAGAFTKLGIWRRVITAGEITSLDSMGPDAYYPWNPDQSPHLPACVNEETETPSNLALSVLERRPS